MLTSLTIVFSLFIIIIWPYQACILLYFLIIDNINIDIGISGFNLRSFFTLAIFFRYIFMGDVNLKSVSKLLSNKHIMVLILVHVYFYFTTILNGYNTFDNLKGIVLDFIIIIITAVLFNKNKDSILVISILLSGLASFSDLIYTYLLFDGFPVRRIISIIFSENQDINHNFLGYLCAASFIIVVFLIVSHSYSKIVKNLLYLFLLVYLSGVMLSTSRSAILGLFVILIFYLTDHNIRKRVLVIVSKFSLIIILVIPIIATELAPKLSKNLVNEIKKRLIEEPVAMYNKHAGSTYNPNDLDSGEWREESSSLAWRNFENLNGAEKIIGIGRGGYIHRNLGDGLSTHNGYLLNLIEYGILGFLSYMLIIIGVIKQSYKYRLKKPYFFLIIYILLYSLPQNEELIGTFMTIIIVSNIYTNSTKFLTQQSVLNLQQKNN